MHPMSLALVVHSIVDTTASMMYLAIYLPTTTPPRWANGALPYIEHSVSCADQVLC